MCPKNRKLADLRWTPDAIVGSDEGTHDGPVNYRVYESVTGRRYALEILDGRAKPVSERLAVAKTQGQINENRIGKARIRHAAAEIKRLTELGHHAG